MSADDFRVLIERGDVDGVRRALESQPALANRPIRWFLNRYNESDPLHYVADCIAQGWLTNGREGEIVDLLLAHGAAIEGSDGRESPLIGSTSLGAERVSRVLVAAGAALERTSVFGARPLHWAAWLGTPSTVELLIAHGADIEARCTEFGATPLFWAVHGNGPNGPANAGDRVAAARALIEAGARVTTANKHGLPALELARRAAERDLYELLRRHGA
jgi:ankyrin repeat protein